MIRGRVATIDPAKVGLPVSVFVEVEAADHSGDWLTRFAGVVATCQRVLDAWRMSGDVDYLMHVVVPDIAAYDEFYRRLIAAVPLRNVTSRFSMERLKAARRCRSDGSLPEFEEADPVGLVRWCVRPRVPASPMTAPAAFHPAASCTASGVDCPVPPAAQFGDVGQCPPRAAHRSGAAPGRERHSDRRRVLPAPPVSAKEHACCCAVWSTPAFRTGKSTSADCCRRTRWTSPSPLNNRQPACHSFSMSTRRCCRGCYSACRGHWFVVAASSDIGCGNCQQRHRNGRSPRPSCTRSGFPLRSSLMLSNRCFLAACGWCRIRWRPADRSRRLSTAPRSVCRRLPSWCSCHSISPPPSNARTR